MIWQESLFLWLLVAVPVTYLLMHWYRNRVTKRRKEFFDDQLFKSLRRGFWSTGDRIRQVLLYIALSVLIVGLAGPKIGTEVREIKRRGVDMLIALDLSSSMNAEDVRPSRLDKAKYEINRLIDRLQGDRVGLIIFTGEAFLQSPMTLDYSALRLFLNIADTDQMPTSSTNFESALSTAIQAFETKEEEDSKSAKVLLIISDGENHTETFDQPLEQLVDEGVTIFTLGIGTSAGSTIPVYDKETGRLTGYKRDNQGKVVTTKLESSLLRQIARDGGGQYYEIQRGSDGIDAFLGRIDELEKGEFASQEYADFKNQYQVVTVFGLLFFVLFLVMPNFKKEHS